MYLLLYPRISQNQVPIVHLTNMLGLILLRTQHSKPTSDAIRYFTFTIIKLIRTSILLYFKDRTELFALTFQLIF